MSVLCIVFLIFVSVDVFFVRKEPFFHITGMWIIVFFFVHFRLRQCGSVQTQAQSVYCLNSGIQMASFTFR